MANWVERGIQRFSLIKFNFFFLFFTFIGQPRKYLENSFFHDEKNQAKILGVVVGTNIFKKKR